MAGCVPGYSSPQTLSLLAVFPGSTSQLFIAPCTHNAGEGCTHEINFREINSHGINSGEWMGLKAEEWSLRRRLAIVL